ncbi:dethiobiotin synthase [Muribaculaceae bacterium Isolate-104 (HZI)]|jgi:dethiobiotin synthetase|nr:dethiobiotin synthase [Muribaculaceae bacterium Isolate-104 (HZI)]
MNIIFVSGTDTDAGKSYATGWLAAQIAREGDTVATMKFVQTGNVGRSEDIEIHRRLMGVDSIPEDELGITAPEIYSYPASPSLAAKIDGRPVDLRKIENCMERLAGAYDTLLVEGAGGLMVPLDYEGTLTIDFPLANNLPVALVTNGKLGSINHTILALEAIRARGMRLHSLLYNTHFDYDPVIAADSLEYMKMYVGKYFPDAPVILIPSLK